MEPVVINVKGDKWKVFFFDEDRFIKRFGEGIAAICIIDDKSLYFHDGDIVKANITHELVHAYYSSMCLGSTTLTNSQLEEIWCDLFALNGATIMRQTNMLWKHLKEMS